MNDIMRFRRDRPHFFAIYLVVAALLGHGNADAADSPFEIDACAAPLRIHLAGAEFHVQEGSKQELDVDSCGDRELLSLYASVADSPKVSIATHAAAVDLRVELPSASYDTKDVPLDGRAIKVTPVGGSGPTLSVSIKRLADQSYAGLQVDNVPSDQLLRELIRVKHLRVLHAEHVTSARISFHFQCVPVRSIIELIAQTSGAQARQDAHGRFDILAIKNGTAIEDLRTQALSQEGAADRAKLRATLQRIIALAQPGGAGEVQADVTDEYAELGAAAMEDKLYAEAEKHYRDELAYVAHRVGKDDPRYALVLANVADARAYEDDFAGSQKLYTQALALMEKHPGPATLPNSVAVIETLASGALVNDHFADAETLTARAYARLQSPHSGDWVAPHLEHAREIASELEEDFGSRLIDKHDLVAAGPHYERALKLKEQLYGAGSDKVDDARRRVVFNLLLQKKIADAANFSRQQLAASDKRGDHTSDAYISALYRLLAIEANYGNPANVIPLWQRMIAARSAVLGEHDAQVVEALRDLGVLYRLDMRPADAVAVEQRVAAIHPTPTDVAALKKLDETTKIAMGYDPAVLVLCDYVATQARALPDKGLVLVPPQPPLPPLLFYLTPKDAPAPIGNAGQAYVLEQDAECTLREGTTFAIHELERAWQLRKAVGTDEPAIRRTAERLAELYDKAGDAAKALKVRASMPR